MLNKYVLITLVFVGWMLFLDSNSWLNHRKLDEQIEEKQADIEFYEKSIARDAAQLKELSTEKGLEKFARERYHMKKGNEEVYIIEYADSSKTDDE